MAAGLGDAFGFEVGVFAEDVAPFEHAGVEVDGGEVSPRWFDAGMALFIGEEIVAEEVVTALVVLFHFVDAGDVVGVDVEDAGFGIDGCAAPGCSAVESGGDEGALFRRGSEGGSVAVVLGFVEDEGSGLGADVGEFGDDIGGEGGGFGRDGLGRPGLYAFEVGGWGGDFVDGEEGLASHAVEEEDVAGFGGLGDGFDCSSCVGDGADDGWAGEVVIPEVVADGLEVPDSLSGFGVEGEGAVAEEVLADTVSAVEVRCGRAESGEEDAVFGIEGVAGPGVGTGAIFPAFALPGVVSEFTGLGDGVESPDFFAGLDVEGANVAGSTGLSFAVDDGDDDEVLVDHGGGGASELNLGQVLVDAVAKFDDALVAELGVGEAGFGVEGD